MRQLLVMLAMVVAAGSAGFAAGVKSSDLVVSRNVTYATAGRTLLKGDIYRPAGAKRLPGVVVVHGGGFVMGDKDMQQLPEAAARIARAGFVVFNINYRLIRQGGTYPAVIGDVHCAVRWLKQHAGEYGADRSRMGLLGASAGGYLALMAGYTSGAKYELESCPADGDSRVKAVVDYYGITDLTTFNVDSGVEINRLLLGKSLPEAPGLYREASPTSRAKTALPTLILHGTADNLVDFDQSVQLAAALKKAGVEVELMRFEGANHGFIHDVDGPVGGPALRRAIEFLKARLKAKK